MGVGLNPSDLINHGTHVGAILGGNSNLGFANRGVTGITLDSFKVTANGASGALDGPGVLRGFSAAIPSGDKVINCSFQAGTDVNSAIAQAADADFDAGTIVVAALGNTGSASVTAQVPGAARKVLAIGAVDAVTLALRSDSGRGPTTDGRTKPDLVAPQNVITPDASSDTGTSVFSQTSCATPHATGAAALFRNWIISSIPFVDPGQVNAFMIVHGGNSGFDDNYGAGLVRLKTSGEAWFASKQTATAGSLINVPINLSGTTSKIEGAIWWPETSSRHNDVDLLLIDPSGVQRSVSTSSASIFEKVSLSTTTSGTWTLQVKSYNVVGSQTVYVAAWQTH